MGGLERGVGHFALPAVLPLLDPEQGAAHHPRLHALQPRAPPVKLRQIFDLLLPQVVSGTVGGHHLLDERFVLLRIFAQGQHGELVVFGGRVKSVLDGVHLHFLLSCLAARSGGVPGVAAGGCDEFRRKFR